MRRPLGIAAAVLRGALTLTDRPVVTAGGIATGAGMAAALVAGAAGVWIGTPLLSCPEGLNSPAARARVRAASGDETVLTRAFDVAEGVALPERWPGRALVNDFSRTWHDREDELRQDAAARQLVVDGRRTGDPSTRASPSAWSRASGQRPTSSVGRTPWPRRRCGRYRGCSVRQRSCRRCSPRRRTVTSGFASAHARSRIWRRAPPAGRPRRLCAIDDEEGDAGRQVR